MVCPAGFEFCTRQALPKPPHVIHRDIVEHDQRVFGQIPEVELPLLGGLNPRVVGVDEEKVYPGDIDVAVGGRIQVVADEYLIYCEGGTGLSP